MAGPKMVVVVVASGAAEREAVARELSARFEVVEVEPAFARAVIADGCCAVVAEQRGGGEALLRELGGGPVRVLLRPGPVSRLAGPAGPTPPTPADGTELADACLAQPWRRGQLASELTRLLHARRRRPKKAPTAGWRAHGEAEETPIEPTSSPLPEPAPDRPLREELQGALTTLHGQDPRAALGLPPNADAAAARKAFLARCKTHHPDRYALHDDSEVKRLATEIFVAFERALAAIRREEAR